MRIVRLDLTRYGKFSDYALDFGETPMGAPDFHVVYGVNEAGKSTIASAILDLLFGIEPQNRYGAAEGKASVPNWHAYNAMRVGARLELASGDLEVARIKRDRGSLLGADNRPIDEGLVAAELAGLDRKAFRMMFSLDDDSLEDGGEAILASKGDLGLLLFSASAGLAEISANIEALRGRADAFFRRNARSGELADKKKALEALKAERERLDTLASAYAQLIERRDNARRAYDQVVSAVGQNRGRADDLLRRLNALPHLAELAEAETTLAPLADLPSPPGDWRVEVVRLRDQAIRLAAQIEGADETVRALHDECARIPLDAPALDAASRVEAWKTLRSRYDSALDIPVRQGELTARRAAAAEILRRLGRENELEPRSLLLAADRKGTLSDLIAERSGVLSALKATREAFENAKAARKEAESKLAAADAMGDDAKHAALRAQLDAARRDDSARAALAAQAEIANLKRALDGAMRALKPWSGDIAALADLEIASEAGTASLRQRLTQAIALRDRRAETRAAKTAETDKIAAEVLSASHGAGGIDDGAASEIRAAREAAWAAHRTLLDIASADRFESALRRDDDVGVARQAAAREIAALRERRTKLAGLGAEASRGAIDAHEAEEALRALETEIRALAPIAPPAGGDLLSAIDGFRTRRIEALKAAEALRQGEDAARTAQASSERTRAALDAALRALDAAPDGEAPLEILFAHADTAIARATEAKHLREAVDARRGETERAQVKLRRDLEVDESWRAAWARACAGSWLGEGDPEPPLGAVRERLAALDELRVAIRDCDDLDHRIAAMQGDRRRFADEVAAIAAALGDEGETSDVADAADRFESRVALARDHARRREEKAKALQEARDKRAELDQTGAANARTVAAMSAFFGVASLGEVAEQLEACVARDAARVRADAAARAILETNVAATIDGARALLNGEDRNALEAELAALRAREPDERKAQEEAYAGHREALKALDAVGGDDGVARIEEQRRTILEEIAQGAETYLRLRFGVAAADEALRRYRDQHRGAMMARASEAFALISRGAYRGLTTQPDGVGETLIALAAEGGAKEADQLSKGARFQLYLALRVAGYHEFARTRRPAPFMADDIMETFDHFRAEEALRLLADMSRVGQVIYFTHHQHLSEIATQVCPQARVHRLPG